MPHGAPLASSPVPISSRPIRSCRWRLAPLVLALATAGLARAQDAAEAPLQLRSATELKPLPRGEANKALPIILRARELRGRPDIETVAEGEAEFRRGGLVLSADQLRYLHPDDLAVARGNVRISRDGNVYSGPELQLHVQRFEGFFLQPSYHFGRTGAGGTARRIDFIDEQRAVATGATYTSCPSDGSGGPAWLLSTDKVKMDFEANEGIAENAVLRFYGVPILGAPVLSFPLTDERKSGWLPPSINIDSKSGLQFSIPWYWNIAPNRDATLTPLLSAKRGVGAEAEFRYLEPSFQGAAQVHVLPNDQLTGRSRHALNLSHEGALPLGANFTFNGLRVSDDAYWKDFPRAVPSITPRLLLADAAVRRDFDGWSSYARVHRWQVLQDDSARIEAPYDRTPQVGVRGTQRFGDGFEFALETELNRFTNPTDGRADPLATTLRPTGVRWHALGSLARPFGTPGWTVTPRVAFNAASYSLDEPLAGRRSSSRVIPTLSLDSHWQFERDASWFGRDVRQTLEPRLMVVNTPYRAQDARLAFDAAPRDFNFESLYAENAFSGVDRVSDAHQLTAGVTTRFLDAATGAEALRLGMVQRYLFRDQRITADCTPSADPLAAPDCTPLTQRFSDLLLLGSTTLSKRWTLDGSIQYSPDLKRTVRSILGARYSPGPYRTFGLTYRLARGLSEQLELGWQWPVYGRTPAEAAASGAGECKGSWYSVGRINYSMRDSRITDSVIGFEYDAGCWIGRVVAERLSTGRSEATTRLLLQLELVGLSRLGSNPLQVLKDNIPGYKLLREERSMPAATRTYD
ncbi:MAG: LPS-assembly protein LptD [Proteobacteria bacterium]|nr:LPS-assembly protein LptD [Pseudomonadota bacterium]